MSDFKSGVTRQFNRSSSTYDQHADLQAFMGCQLAGQLENHSRVRRILELGCGTGGLTTRLLAAYPKANIVAIDLAESMVGIARSRADGSTRVEFRVADAETTDWNSEDFDLIVSNATVQWFEEPDRTIRSLVKALRPGGVMRHSSFGPGTFKELHETMRAIEREREPISGDYGLSLMTAADWEELLRSSGLSDVQAETSFERRFYPGLMAFLQTLKGIGAAFASGRPPQAARYRSLKELVRRYDRTYSTPQGVFVTYEVLQIAGTLDEL